MRTAPKHLKYYTLSKHQQRQQGLIGLSSKSRLDRFVRIIRSNYLGNRPVALVGPVASASGCNKRQAADMKSGHLDLERATSDALTCSTRLHQARHEGNLLHTLYSLALFIQAYAKNHCTPCRMQTVLLQMFRKYSMSVFVTNSHRRRASSSKASSRDSSKDSTD